MDNKETVGSLYTGRLPFLFDIALSLCIAHIKQQMVECLNQTIHRFFAFTVFIR